MRISKPKRLRGGYEIGLCAPATPPDPERLNQGVRYIESLRYRVELSKNILRKRGYLAGTDRERTDDLQKLFSNRHVTAIFCARGGYGTHRILPLLDFNLIRRNPKIVV